MKILITGSNGLLGQKLVQLIIQEGKHEIIASSRGQNRLPENNSYRFISLDITDEKAVKEIVTQEKPDAIINTAAMTNVDQCETEQKLCWSLNVDSVKFLTEACKNTGSFLLHLSTDFIFDGKDGPYKEEDIPNPISFYGESKLAAEKIVKESNIDWAIARTVLVYGIAHDMSRSNIILWVKKSLEEDKTLNVVDDQWRSPTLAEDLAKGCLLIVEKKAQGIFNISGKDIMTPYEMAIETADYFGLNKELINKTDGSKFKQTAERPPKTGFILDKAYNVLGYKPHSFKEGIAILSKQLTTN